MTWTSSESVSDLSGYALVGELLVQAASEPNDDLYARTVHLVDILLSQLDSHDMLSCDGRERLMARYEQVIANRKASA